ADPGPLQDFCLADLNSPLFINGYPCRNPALAISDDF
nr:RecName: Full=Peruvianin-1; AltName: Full=Peruvianin-I [Thevetia peruviana]